MKDLTVMNTKLSRRNLSDEVTLWLQNAIAAGTYKPGDRLPSVETLAMDLNVGRSSVREALRTLQAKGMLEIYHGKGCFVAAPKIHLGSVLKSFSENIRQRGMAPGSRILKLEVAQPDEKIRQHLKLEKGEKVNFLHRLRLADNEPLAIEISCTPHRLLPDLLDLPWDEHTSLYQVLREKYRLYPAYAKQSITAILLSEYQSSLLGVGARTPGLSIVQIAFSEGDVPIEYAQDIYRGDRYQYDIVLLAP